MGLRGADAVTAPRKSYGPALSDGAQTSGRIMGARKRRIEGQESDDGYPDITGGGNAQARGGRRR